MLEEWALCQRSWLYLEPIFSSDDINRQLPVEGKRYQTMDRLWRKIMNNAKQDPKVQYSISLIESFSIPLLIIVFVSFAFLFYMLPFHFQVISFCPDNHLLDNLRECNKLLDQVQKGLSEYLETKRLSFPR